MEKVPVPSSPGRLINAIARIGYDPEVALCDLIDNSIDANSSHISVELVPEYREEEGQTDSIHEYVIADNGCGMNREGLVKAFALGSDREYPSGSLGKFGLGLKSAGLALGDKIVLISKTKEMTSPVCGILSIQAIQDSENYEIDLGEIPEKYNSFYEKHLLKNEQGTILILEGLNGNQPSYSKFLAYFKRYCSIIYHLFLEEKVHGLQIKINNILIEPKDPLFFEEAINNGSLADPLQWNGKDVKLLLQEHTQPLTPEVCVKIALTHLVHPPSFDIGAKGKRAEIRDKYLIETDPYTRRARHGFYIYRNKRIIVLAERFHGLISSATQAWAFRGRLMFNESADKILSLDVKKRHCRLPKEARNNLQALIKTYQSKSIDAWKEAGRKAKQEKKRTKEQDADDSIKNSPVVQLDYSPGHDLSSQTAIEERQALLKKLESSSLKEIADKKISKETLDNNALAGGVVITADGLKGNSMWLPYPSTEIGTAEILINNLHSWISEAYAMAEESPKITLVLHQLFTILARAELEVRSTPWKDVPPEHIDKIIERFRRKASAIAEDLADSLSEYSETFNEEID